MDGKKYSRSAEDNEAHWGGWTRSLDFPFPLEQIEKDGYTVQELRDKFGKYYQIIRKI